MVYQLAALHMIYGVKVYPRRKSRVVIGFHIVDYSRHKVYESTMTLVLSRILLKIASENGLRVMMGDIGNAYLNADTNKNIYRSLF